MSEYLPKSISYTQLKETEWPEDIFIEGGFLSRGDRLMVGGESKAGKSTLLSGLNRELITGGNFLGFKVTRPLKVLYIQAELRERRLKERLSNSFDPLKDEHKENFRIWTTRNSLILPRDLVAIHREIEYCKPDIAEFDPFISFHDKEENSASEMADVFRAIDAIKEKHDIAIILAHHFRKKAQDAKIRQSLLEMIRGSASMRGWADTTIAMEGRTNSGYRDLEFEFRNRDEPIKRIIKYNKKTKDFDWHDPISTISIWLSDNMTGSMGTNAFITYLLQHHGDLLSHNRTKAFDIKEVLVNTNFLKATPSGKAINLSLA